MTKNLRPKQAADYLGLSKSFLDKARCYGGGPAYMRLGRSIVYSSVDLDEWTAARRVETAANSNIAVRAAA